MKTKNILIAFAVTALVQLFIPLKMIYDSHVTETDGVEYHFKARPIDPNDPFRGKYITLAFEMETVATKDSVWNGGETVYVTLGKDKDGFATAASASLDKPEDTVDFITAEAQRYYEGVLYITLPFDRYYMAEGKAAAAESAYNQFAATQDYKPVYAVVAVHKGNSVLKDVVIDGMPIKDYVVKNRDKKLQ